MTPAPIAPGIALGLFPHGRGSASARRFPRIGPEDRGRIMSGDLVGDYGVMEAAGTAIRSAGYDLQVTCAGDTTGNGSQSIEYATQEFALRISVRLRGIQTEVTGVGQLALDAAALLEQADAQLAGGTP